MRKATVLLILVARVASADDEVRVDLKADLSVIAVGGLGFALTTIFQSKLAPSECRWCDRSAGGGETLNGFDQNMRSALRWSNPDLANTLSNVGGFVLAPAAAFGLTAIAAAHDDRLSNWPTDALVIVESMVLAADLNQAVKLLAGRARPAIHMMSAADMPSGTGNNLSFYSGHASLAFSLAVSAGTVASMRGYRYAPLVWAVGLTVATGVGYLRIAADRHYTTDVLTGAAMGSLIGVVVPYVFHGAPKGFGAEPIPGGGMLMFSGKF